LDCATLNLTTGNAAGGNGTVDLDAGTLICTNITVGSAAANGWGLVNFNGGTLKLGAGSTALFKQNNLVPLTNIVQVGGAFIDTAGFSTVFNFPLLTDPNLAGAPDGGLVKLGAGTLTLNNPGTYIGNTVVSNGTLAVNTALAATIVTVAGGTLSGNGSVGSNVTVNAGAVIAPAGNGVIGTFTIAGNLALNGTAAMELNHTTGTNDVLAVTGNLTYGGVLAVTNLAGSLTSVDTFKLFSAAAYAGGFTAIAPSIPGAGLAWNTNTLTTDGTLRLVATVNTSPTNITTHVSGNTLMLSWPSDHTGWRLQVQTNSLAVGLHGGGTWTDIPNSTSVNSVNITINPANGTVFYRMVYP
jgi:autotransporter-associated beta strand protein